jgi:hypothetical protein
MASREKKKMNYSDIHLFDKDNDCKENMQENEIMQNKSVRINLQVGEGKRRIFEVSLHKKQNMHYNQFIIQCPILTNRINIEPSIDSLTNTSLKRKIIVY